MSEATVATPSIASLFKSLREAQEQRPGIYKRFDEFRVGGSLSFVIFADFSSRVFGIPWYVFTWNLSVSDVIRAFKELIEEKSDQHHGHHHHGPNRHAQQKLAKFQEKAAQITQEFQAVSVKIREVEAEFVKLGKNDVAALIRELQLLEKDNLMTARFKFL